MPRLPVPLFPRSRFRSDAATKAIIEAANTERGSAQQFVIDPLPSHDNALFVQPDAEAFVKARLKASLDSFYGGSGGAAAGSEGGAAAGAASS